MNNNRKITISIIVILLISISFFGVAFAFFNYARTGAPNTIRTGRITFTSSQNGSISLNNMFPMSSTAAQNANDNVVTIDISGDTNYVGGEEFVVSFVDVEQKVNGKNIPLSFIATYEAKANKSIGTASNDYWNDREDRDADIYTLTSSGLIKEGRELLVGYIDDEGNGIDGTLTIKAFIDDDRMAVTDTYPSGMRYVINPNMDANALAYCISFSEDYWGDLDEGESHQAYCEGTGTAYGETFQYELNHHDWYFTGNYANAVEGFLANGVIIANDNGTTDEWVDDRLYFTTDEWNSLTNTSLSFKIKVESNEGIWIDEPIGEINSCPDCKFLFSTATMYTTWRTNNKTPTTITSGLYDSYLELIYDTNLDYFLGVKLNNNNQATNVYACGIKNNIPFCLEGVSGNSKYQTNKTLLQGENLWNNTCEEINGRIFICGESYSNNNNYVDINIYGYALIGINDDDGCYINGSGSFSCKYNNMPME